MRRNCFYFVFYFSFAAIFFASCKQPPKATTKATVLAPSLPPTSLPPTFPQPVTDKNLAHLAPGNYQQASWINVKLIRKSPLWKAINAFSKNDFVVKFQNDIGLNLLHTVNEILIISGHDTSNTKDEFVAIAKGSFDAHLIIENISKSAQAETIIVNEFKTVQKQNFFISAITNRTIIFGSPKLVTKSLSLARHKGLSIIESNEFKDFNLDKNKAAIIQYRKNNTTLNFAYFSETPLDKFAWISNIVNLNTSFYLKTGLKIESNLKTQNNKEAILVKNDLQKLINQTALNPFVALLQVDWIFSKVIIDTNKNNVIIKLDLDKTNIAELQKLIDPILKIRQLINEEKTSNTHKQNHEKSSNNKDGDNFK